MEMEMARIITRVAGAGEILAVHAICKLGDHGNRVIGQLKSDVALCTEGQVGLQSKF